MIFSDIKLIELLRKVCNEFKTEFYNKDCVEFSNINEFREFIVKSIVDNFLPINGPCHLFIESTNWISIQNSIVNVGDFKFYISFKDSTYYGVDLFNLKVYLWEENINRIKNLLSFKTGRSFEIEKKNELTHLSEIVDGKQLFSRIRNIDDLKDIITFITCDELLNSILETENMTLIFDYPISDSLSEYLPLQIYYPFECGNSSTNYFKHDINFSVIDNYDNRISIRLSDYKELYYLVDSYIKNEYITIENLYEGVYLVGFDKDYMNNNYTILTIVKNMAFPISISTDGIQVYSYDELFTYHDIFKITDIDNNRKSMVQKIRNSNTYKNKKTSESEYIDTADYIELGMPCIDYFIITISKNNIG